MVYRIYSEKRPEFSEAAEGLAKDIREFLGIRTLEGVRTVSYTHLTLPTTSRV